MSGTLLSIILSFPWAYSRTRSFKVMRSRKDQTENFVFGRRGSCFRVNFSSRTRKMTLEHFLNGPNRTSFENQKNAEIAGNIVKNGRFRPSKRQNPGILKISTLNFVHVYTWQGTVIYILFYENSKISPCFENSIFVDYFLQFSNFWKSEIAFC